jgi:hypothetical protein
MSSEQLQLRDAPAPPPPDNESPPDDFFAPIRRALLNVFFHERDGPNVSRFFLEHGRLPFLSDEIKPWKYRAWLLPYVMMLHGNPFFGKPTDQLREKHPGLVSKLPAELRQRGAGNCPDRWGYYLKLLDADSLIDEPIPQLHFSGVYNEHHQNHALREFRKILEQLGYNHGFGERALTVFIDWLAWALGVEREEPRFIDEKTNEYLYRTFNLEPWLLDPYDYIGEMLQEYRGRSAKWRGFYLTPHTICEMMTMMLHVQPADALTRVGPHGHDPRTETVYEPACGTGRMLLHASNYHLRMYGQDIDGVCVKVTKINGALYAPWLAFPLPQSIFGEEAEVVPPPPAPLPLRPVMPYSFRGQPVMSAEAMASFCGVPIFSPSDAPAEDNLQPEPMPLRVDDYAQGQLFHSTDD